MTETKGIGNRLHNKLPRAVFVNARISSHMGSAGHAETSTSPTYPTGMAQIADLLLRAGLLVAVLIALGLRFDGRTLDAVSLPLVIAGVSVGIYLLIALPSVSALVHHSAQRYPLFIGLSALLLVLPAGLLTPTQIEFDPADLIFAAMLLILPVGCAVLNTPELRRNDIALGLMTTSLPVLLPLTRNPSGSLFAVPLEFGEIILRTGALVLPVALLLLATPQQRQRLNFLLICAVLSIWYGVEFDAFPAIPIDPAVNLNYFYVASILALLYALAASGWLPQVGFRFNVSLRDLGVVVLSLVLFAVPAIGVGLVSGFLKPELRLTSPFEALTQAGGIYLFVALPEEILFRGILLKYLRSTLAISTVPALLLSAVIFGAAHLNNPPDVGWYFVLATLAGVAYGWAFLRTEKATLSALVHAGVNWIWWMGFSG